MMDQKKQYLLIQCKKCHVQTFSHECKYKVKEETVKRYITEDLTDSEKKRMNNTSERGKC